MTKDIAPAKLSSTVLLLRERAGVMEVFMTVRHHEVEFMPSAAVFPGGAISAADTDPGVRSLCDGENGLDDQVLGFRVTAIREAFEEAGVLFAREPSGALVGPERLETLQAYRRMLDTDEIGMKEFLQTESLRLACDLLQPFAHWITPVIAGKRFDTQFFLAISPQDQVAAHDGREMVESVWINPDQALKDAEAKLRNILFPTRMILRKLNFSASIEAALQRARTDPWITILPEIVPFEGGVKLVIPAEAGYGITEELIPKG